MKNIVLCTSVLEAEYHIRIWHSKSRYRYVRTHLYR